MPVPTIFAKSWPIFRGLQDEEIEIITRDCDERNYKAGEVILKEGALPVELFVVLEGECEVRSHFRGQEIPIAKIGPTEVFGEVGFVDEFPRSANVIAIKPTRVLILKKPDFQKIINANPALGVKLYRNLAYILARRIRETDNKVKQLFIPL